MEDDPSSRPSKSRASASDIVLLTVEEVAELLRMTKKGIYALVEGRRIPFVKVSNRLRFIRSDVLGWLQENRVPALEKTR